MNYKDILKHYQDYDDIRDEELIDEAIGTLEQYFGCMNEDELMHRSRPLAIAYLALLTTKVKQKGGGEA